MGSVSPDQLFLCRLICRQPWEWLSARKNRKHTRKWCSWNREQFWSHICSQKFRCSTRKPGRMQSHPKSNRERLWTLYQSRFSYDMTLGDRLQNIDQMIQLLVMILKLRTEQSGRRKESNTNCCCVGFQWVPKNRSLTLKYGGKNIRWSHSIQTERNSNQSDE